MTRSSNGGQIPWTNNRGPIRLTEPNYIRPYEDLTLLPNPFVKGSRFWLRATSVEEHSYEP